MALFSTILLAAQFLVVISKSAVPSPGRRQIAGALTNNSMVNNSGSAFQTKQPDLQQATKSLPAVPSSTVNVPVVKSQVYELRLEVIKQQILKKLQMEHEPTYIARPDVSLPEPLADLSMDNNKQESKYADKFQGNKTQVIVVGEKVSNKTSTAAGQGNVTNRISLEFRFTEKVYKSSIDSAFLWIRKRQKTDLDENNVEIILKEEVTGQLPQKRQRKQITTTIKNKGSWLIVGLKKVVQEWSEKDRGKNAPNSTSFLHTLEVSCTNCQPNSLLAKRAKYRPFLVIDVSSANEETTRRKRSIECATHVKDCCREQFYVSFHEDLHWSTWVVQPKGFYANYCKGSCQGSFASKYYHTFLMKKLSATRANLEPCCSPTKLSSLSMIYYETGLETGSYTLIKRDLPGMRVDECGCT